MNVYTDSYEEVLNSYPRRKMGGWKKANTLALFNTPESIGSFAVSDIIIVYNKDTHTPDIITERIYRKNYTVLQWFKIRRQLLYKSHNVMSEWGFNYSVTFSRNHIDSCHFREEWWRWARRNLVH